MTSPGDPALVQARDHFLAGVAAFEAGRLADAERALEAAHRLMPQRVSVLVNLAATRLALGAPATALPLLESALALEPDDAQAWCHHGCACAALGRDRDALASFDRALALPGAPAVTELHRAMALRRLGAMEPALQAWRAACAAQPQAVEAWIEQGQLLQALQRHDEAEACWRHACALPDAPARAFGLLGALLKDSGRLDEARDCLRRAWALDPADPALQFLLASLGQATAPPQPPAHYVRSLFDDYAPRFDQHLVEVLDYQAPQRLAECLPPLAPGTRLLDLGCGTGLMAQALQVRGDRGLALDGVDLAGAMLDAARARGLYRDLAQADVAEHLARTEARYDWVLATDVFIYIGALEVVFAGVARVLAPGGGFAFSVERLAATDAAPAGWCLTRHSRYAHGEAYLRALAGSVGFRIERLTEGPLRREQQAPVAGLYLVLRRA